MWIDIERLRKEPFVYDVDLSPDYLRGDIEEDLRFEPGRGTVTFRMVRNEVMATGELSTTAYSHCGRCLGPVVRSVKVQVELFYWPNEEDTRREELEAEDELGPESPDVAFYDKGGFDPDEELRQLLVVEVPTILVCSDTCRGLCPTCGANLNEGDCACGPQAADGAPGAETAAAEFSPWKAQLRKLGPAKPDR